MSARSFYEENEKRKEEEAICTHFLFNPEVYQKVKTFIALTVKSPIFIFNH